MTLGVVVASKGYPLDYEKGVKLPAKTDGDIITYYAGSQSFPRPEHSLFRSFHHGDHYRIWRLCRVILISLLNCLASDICSVEEAFCFLLGEFLVDGILGVFDGVFCGN